MKKLLTQITDSSKLGIYFILLITAIQIINSVFFSQQLGTLGIHPRSFSGLLGIFFAPFLHGSYNHLIGNSIMIFLLSWIICFQSKELWFKTIIYGTIIGGIFTWLFGFGGYHFGASGIVFALWGSIFGIAIFKRNPFFILASLVLASSYGLGFIYGLIPQQGISFVGHLGGLIAGFACARQIEYNK